ncbi:hypothetical protein LTR56_003954 [Elasticomyces elasticus]|nr:hypothetical protein LTR56_003954 [Elasticomyces elasticus]KAK3661058.1 hypothetical protein LTR22_007684 [Elasticomyces elasticus]KAK5752972.1 hypothetical protein LTS12_016943 [Elasticomyces elasticus]
MATISASPYYANGTQTSDCGCRVVVSTWQYTSTSTVDVEAVKYVHYNTYENGSVGWTTQDNYLEYVSKGFTRDDNRYSTAIFNIVPTSLADPTQSIRSNPTLKTQLPVCNGSTVLNDPRTAPSGCGIDTITKTISTEFNILVTTAATTISRYCSFAECANPLTRPVVALSSMTRLDAPTMPRKVSQDSASSTPTPDPVVAASTSSSGPTSAAVINTLAVPSPPETEVHVPSVAGTSSAAISSDLGGTSTSSIELTITGSIDQDPASPITSLAAGYSSAGSQTPGSSTMPTKTSSAESNTIHVDPIVSALRSIGATLTRSASSSVEATSGFAATSRPQSASTPTAMSNLAASASSTNANLVSKIVPQAEAGSSGYRSAYTSSPLATATVSEGLKSTVLPTLASSVSLTVGGSIASMGTPFDDVVNLAATTGTKLSSNIRIETKSHIPVTIAGVQITADSAGVYIVSSQTLSGAGSAITLEGTEYSLATSGSMTALVVNGRTQALVDISVSTTNSDVLTTNAVVQSVSSNSASGTADGTYGTLAPTGSAPLPVSQTPSTKAPVITIAGQQFTAGSAGQYTISSQVLTAGGPAVTIEGTTYSLATSGTALVVNGRTQIPAFSTFTATSRASQIITVARAQITADPAGQYSISGQVLSPGGPPITLQSTVYSLATSGNALLVNGRTQPLAMPTPGPVVSGVAFTAGFGHTTGRPGTSTGDAITAVHNMQALETSVSLDIAGAIISGLQRQSTDSSGRPAPSMPLVVPYTGSAIRRTTMSMDAPVFLFFVTIALGLFS